MNSQSYFDSYQLFMSGDVNGEMLEKYDSDVKRYFEIEPPGRSPIAITLSTPGGRNDVARALHERLRLLVSVADVTLVAVGQCMSAGVTLLMAAPRDRRVATRHTRFLIHQTYFKASYQLPEGTAQVRDLQIRELDALHIAWVQDQEWAYDILSQGCGQTKPHIKSLAVPGTYFSARKARDFGIIGSVMA